MDFLCLRLFGSVLDRLLDDLRGGLVPVWAGTSQEAQALVAAFGAVRTETESWLALLRSGASRHRGASTALPLPASVRLASATLPAPNGAIEAIRPCLPAPYGAAEETARRETHERLWTVICETVPAVDARLVSEAVRPADLEAAFAKASPLGPIDETVGHGLRARFVVTRGGDASPLHAVVTSTVAGAHPVDRERWIDLGPELEDELVIVTFEDGTPLRAMKPLHRARQLYAQTQAPARDLAHLEPLFAFLPDPLGEPTAREAAPARRWVLMGLVGGTLRRRGSLLTLVDEHGAERPFAPELLDRHAVLVGIASRFISRIHREGVASVIREAEAACNHAEDGAEMRALVAELRRLAAVSHQPVWDEPATTR